MYIADKNKYFELMSRISKYFENETTKLKNRELKKKNND